jgi:hypothetical protein
LGRQIATIMTKLYHWKLSVCALTTAMASLLSCGNVNAQRTLGTSYFSVTLDTHGYITSMKNTSVTPNKEFSPSDKPSPLLCLYDNKKNLYYYPSAAVYSADTVRLSYSNGSVATVNISAVNSTYFKLVLQDVVPRNGIDVVQWGGGSGGGHVCRKVYKRIENRLT